LLDCQRRSDAAALVIQEIAGLHIALLRFRYEFADLSTRPPTGRLAHSFNVLTLKRFNALN